MAGFGEFCTDGGCGPGLGSGGSFVPPAGGVLGSRYNPGHRAVVPGCGVCRFLAAFCRHRAGGGSGRDCGQILRAEPCCIRCGRVLTGTALRRSALGSKRIPLRGSYAGDCGVDSASRATVASRRTPVLRSLYRNCGGVTIGLGVARERGPDLRVKTKPFSTFPLEDVVMARKVALEGCSP